MKGRQKVGAGIPLDAVHALAVRFAQGDTVGSGLGKQVGNQFLE
jgi:hypothetical protein